MWRRTAKGERRDLGLGGYSHVSKARIALRQLSESTDPDDMHLLRRIQNTKTLVWDSGSGGFQ